MDNSRPGKITLDIRRTIEKLLNEGASIFEISQSLGLNRGCIYKEIYKGTKNGSYSADYAQEVTVARLDRQANVPFCEVKKTIIRDGARRGNSMRTICGRANTSPRRAYLFLKSEGLEAPYEEWKDWSYGLYLTRKLAAGGETLPGEQKKDRFQRQLDLIHEQIESINMQLQILSEQIKQRSSP